MKAFGAKKYHKFIKQCGWLCRVRDYWGEGINRDIRILSLSRPSNDVEVNSQLDVVASPEKEIWLIWDNDHIVQFKPAKNDYWSTQLAEFLEDDGAIDGEIVTHLCIINTMPTSQEVVNVYHSPHKAGLKHLIIGTANYRRALRR